MRERDELGSYVNPTTASWAINDLILNEGIYDPQEISSALLKRGIKARTRSGYWSNYAENKFDMMMNRVLSHVKFLRDEKTRPEKDIWARMRNTGYSDKEIEERIAWLKSVLP